MDLLNGNFNNLILKTHQKSSYFLLDADPRANTVCNYLVGRENRLEIYCYLFCSIFKIIQHTNSNQDVYPLAGQAPRTNFHSWSNIEIS